MTYILRTASAEAVKAVVHAFISSRLVYCNSLLTGVNDGLLRRLQSVQNAAARLVTGARRCEHITPALRQLHWLPVRQRIQYKLASLAFRALSGLASDYLAGDCQLVADSGRRTLRSAERRVCTVPRQNRTFGDRSFAAAGPRAWNELPFSLRDTGLLPTTFNAHLKTYLFSTVFDATTHLWHLWFLCTHINVLTYLLNYLFQLFIHIILLTTSLSLIQHATKLMPVIN